MSDQWKLVPVELTAEMLEAGDEAARAGGCDLYGMRREMMNGYKAMLAAAPVPPAGDVEVLAWQVDDGTRQKTAFVNDPTGWAHGYKVTELVDRAHVTRLQEQCGRLDYDFATVSAERDELLAEVNDLRGALQGALYVAQENEALQSELTRARELLAQGEDENTVLRGALKDVLDWIECSQSSAALRSIAQNALDYSAPNQTGEQS